MANSASDETIKIKNAAREAKDSFQSISAILATTAKTTKAAAEIQDRINKSVKGQADLADQLNVLEQEKQTYLQEYIKSGKIINDSMVVQMDLAIDITKSKIQQKDLEEEIKDLAEGYKDELFGSLGTLGQMLKAGTTLGFAMEALKGTTAAIGDIFKTTVGLASDLNQELGMSGAAAMEAGMMNFSAAAVFSKFSIAELNQATKDFATTMGTTAGLTNDLRNSMAAMSKMGVGGEDAAKMAQSMESAGGSANDMTEEISKMAQDAGVLASVTFKDMASQQKLMVGMSEKEIKLLAQKTIAMNKQGRSLSDMRGIADNMLDIESSMKAQAKARIMLGDKLTATQMEGMQGMTAAAMEFMNTGNTDALNAALDKTNMSAEKFKELGPLGMEQYAAAIGMSSDMLSEQIQKRDQAKKIEESSDLDKGLATALDLYQRTPDAIKEGTTALIGYIAQMGIMNLMQGKSVGLKNLIPGMGGKGGGGQTDLSNSEAKPTKASQGSGKGLKSLAGGLKAMGSGKVLAGIFNMALAGPALLLSLPAIPFLLFMGKVKLKALKDNFTGLGRGLSQMTQAAVGALVLLLAIPALALGMLAIPFLLFMSIPGLGAALTTNFAGLAAGLTAFGNPATAIAVLIGIGLLAALGVAMIPFAYSLSLLSPLVEAFGNIFIGVFAAIPPIITAVADGLVNMMNAVTMENVGAMLLLGPALMGVAFGLAAIGMMGVPGLLALTGLGAVTVLLAPTLMGIADSIGDMMGGSDDTDSNSDNSDSKLIDAINGLRGDIQSQPILISVDGKVVSEITKIQSRQGVSKNVYRK